MRAALKRLFLISVVSSLILSQYAFAYRPFVSTDAAVADKNKWEIELGLFTISHAEGKDETIVPSIRANYGIFKNWEIIGEFDLQVYKEREEPNRELKDPALFLKGILTEGLLQGQQGQSFAVEFGVLLPSTVKGQSKFGFEGIAILSGKISDLAYHLNFGGELDREDFGLNAIWGTILEYPLGSKFRVVGEINGTFQRRGLPSNSGLIGFIWALGDIDLDFGIRKGFSNAASDWALTTGITFSF